VRRGSLVAGAAPARRRFAGRNTRATQERPRHVRLAAHQRYNRLVLKPLRRIVPFVLLSILFGVQAVAQSPATASKMLLVVPFENTSGTPGLEWIGEAFPEILGQRMASRALYVVGRDDRLRAFDEAGLPATLHASRATLYRIAEQMGVDYVIFGSFSFDGRVFRTKAQLLDMQRLRLSQEVNESGPLIELIDLETALAWDLLRSIRPDFPVSRSAFQAGVPPIRLDAFENYIRGVVAGDPDEKIWRFREAVRIAPNYNPALLQLGKAYYRARQYDQAINSLEKIPRGDSIAREATFYLGLAAYYHGDFARAENAFHALAAQLPLTEVYNNLGVVAARRGEKNAAEYFQKAVQADPADSDYRFNLAISYFRAGDQSNAARQLREALSLRPNDSEAKAFLDGVSSMPVVRSAQSPAGQATRIPLERIKRNYDESSFRQLVIEIQAEAETRLAKTDPHTHARFHVTRGHELLAQGFVSEAESEFREATTLDSANADGHAGLARVLEAKSDAAGARAEANAALRIRAFAEPLLVLARLDLSDNKTDTAAESVNRALQLEPSNSSALALKRAIAAKLAEKAQPLPNP
jgi:tetratricopeptide (TPR) repeat protein